RQANELPLGRVGSFDPAAYTSSRPGAGGRLLGIEAPLWTEHVTSAANAEIMWWPRLLAVAEVAWHGKPDSAEFMTRAYAGAKRLRDAGVAVGPADRGLLQLRFDYDSATRTMRAVHQAGMPDLQLMMTRPGSTGVPLASGAALPDAGTWQLSAMWRGQSVGESRTVHMQPH